MRYRDLLVGLPIPPHGAPLQEQRAGEIKSDCQTLALCIRPGFTLYSQAIWAESRAGGCPCPRTHLRSPTLCPSASCAGSFAASSRCLHRPPCKQRALREKKIKQNVKKGNKPKQNNPSRPPLTRGPPRAAVARRRRAPRSWRPARLP